MLIKNLSKLHYDVIGLEKLFSNLSKKGIHLIKYQGDFAYFEEGAPEIRRYRLIFHRDMNNSTLSSHICQTYKIICNNEKNKLTVFELSEEQYKACGVVYSVEQLRMNLLLGLLKQCSIVLLVMVIALCAFFGYWHLLKDYGVWLTYLVFPMNLVMPISIGCIGAINCILILWEGLKTRRRIGQNIDVAEYEKQDVPKRNLKRILTCIFSGILVLVFCFALISPFACLLGKEYQEIIGKLPKGSTFIALQGQEPRVQIDQQSVGMLFNSTICLSNQRLEYRKGTDELGDASYMILFFRSKDTSKLKYTYEKEKKEILEAFSEDKLESIKAPGVKGFQIVEDKYYYCLIQSEKSVLQIIINAELMPDSVDFIPNLSEYCLKIQQDLE